MSKPSDRFAGSQFGYRDRVDGDGLPERKGPLDWAKFWFAQIAMLGAWHVHGTDWNYWNYERSR